MQEINIVFPHQLFRNNPCLDKHRPVYLIQSPLYFTQFPFHKQKLIWHFSTMHFYQHYLEEKGFVVHMIEYDNNKAALKHFFKFLSSKSVKKLHYINTVDFLLEKRLLRYARHYKIEAECYDTPAYLNSRADVDHYFARRQQHYHLTDFYIQFRKDHKLLMNGDSPKGGKWTYDVKNREKWPKGKTPPALYQATENDYTKAARELVEKEFNNNWGSTQDYIYPHSYYQAEKWLDNFLENRFKDFGTYQDAIVPEKHFLCHSLLSPLLNCGLLTPQEVIDKTIDYAKHHQIPLNSLEGFLRQIIGWREFIRILYEKEGVRQRNKNFWNHDRKIPAAFREGKTGILPIDQTIIKLQESAYSHHIERLMILGNFMLLCEFDPKEVYEWFMTFYIDAYDWVMVPNVYGMSQYADGGLMSTKPYISSSNYILKMSTYKKGDWCIIWDGLFWRFINKHEKIFDQNPRMNMMVKMWHKMDKQKQQAHLKAAEGFLKSL